MKGNSAITCFNCGRTISKYEYNYRTTDDYEYAICDKCDGHKKEKEKMFEYEYIVMEIQENPSIGGNEYLAKKDGFKNVFLFEATARKLKIKDIKVGDRIVLVADQNGYYISGKKL